MLNYSRSIPRNSTADLFDQVEQHVRQHLSAVADPDDNPDTHSAEAEVWQEADGDNIKIRGRLNAELNAPYLRDDFDPATEAAENPLTVTSIDDDPLVLHAESREED